MKGFSTKAIHGKRTNTDIHRALRPPIYDCAAFEFESAEDIESAFLGRKPAHSYGRISNPTVAEFEIRAANLFDAQGAVALASGMAAITSTLLALVKSGESIIAPRRPRLGPRSPRDPRVLHQRPQALRRAALRDNRQRQPDRELLPA